MSIPREPYPSDVSDDEWALAAPYLTLLPEDASQRTHGLREVFNGLRYIVKTGAPWRWMPNDLPPWEIVYQQAQRWLRAGCFEALAEDLRVILRLAAGRPAQPTAAILCARRPRVAPAAPTTEPSARRVRSCIWPSTRLAIFWRCMSRPPTLTTAPRLAGSPRRFRQRLVRASKSPSLTRATQATNLRQRLQNTALPSRS